MKKNISLIVGILLPIIFIIVIAVILYLPQLAVNPTHDFIYTLEDRYGSDVGYNHTYDIEGDEIVLKKLSREGFESSRASVPINIINTSTDESEIVAPDLYYYDVENHRSNQISLEEAKSYAVVPGPTSPDGYVIEYNSGNYGIFELFGSSRDSRGYYIRQSDGAGSEKLTSIAGDRGYYYRNLKLIGWIK